MLLLEIKRRIENICHFEYVGICENLDKIWRRIQQIIKLFFLSKINIIFYRRQVITSYKSIINEKV